MSQQPDLFGRLSDPSRSGVHVRHDARPTSASAASMAFPRSGTQRMRVLAAISARHGGATDDDVIASTGMLHQSVGPRRLELERGGWIEDSGRRRKTRMGNDAIVWELTDLARARLRP